MSRAPLESLDNPESTGRPSRVLSRGSPVGALVVAPWAGRPRRREVETALAAPSEALAARGVRPPPRATRAEAHERRPAARSPSLLATLHARGQAMAPGHGCRFHNPLRSWDSTTLARGWHLCPGARCRTATGARQGPTLLEHAGPLPAVVVMTAGPRRAIAIARGLQLPKGSLVALDRGDLADQVLCRRTQDRVSGVTRQQVQATYPVTACLAVHWRPGVTSDQHLGLRGPHGPADPDALRRVGSRDPETGHHKVFWTHAFQLAATTMAAIDTARWPIELCFKTITQHLKRQPLLGTSAHAGMTHMGIALIPYRRLAFLRCKSGVGRSCHQLRRRLHMNLFDRRPRVD